ncbi:hypothetical protein JTB14_006602 [Gonioctena quinquepunctata]|nr:hypothetical protein JTB14_006602 [Gonioctena quinquepunctata]
MLLFCCLTIENVSCAPESSQITCWGRPCPSGGRFTTTGCRKRVRSIRGHKDVLEVNVMCTSDIVGDLNSMVSHEPNSSNLKNYDEMFNKGIDGIED